jgi:DNA (cytosine-5)-methyltransferase 1
VTRKLRLLDAFCCAGGSGMGFHRAGFDEIVGVDWIDQPHYPFEFHKGDALEFIAKHGHEFDFINASPPCKKNTSLKAFSAAHHLELIPQTRELLNSIGVPYVIENVVGAAMIDPVMLCGSMFGLGVRRHRLFESNLPLQAPKCDHKGQAAASPGYPTLRYHSGKPIVTMSPVIGVYGRGQGLGPGEVQLWRQAMGIDWMARDEMREAIPPHYTEFLGRQVIPLLQANAA